jgi:hypothetical protein
MYSIIKFKDYCFSSTCFSMSGGIYNYLTQVHGRNNFKYDFSDILAHAKKRRTLCIYPNTQNLNDNCFGMISDGFRKIFLNKDEIDEQEILKYLPKSDFIINHSYYSIVSGGSSEKIKNLSVLLTGPGTYGTAFIISNGETKLGETNLRYWPLNYIDKEKNLIWFLYADEYEDDDGEDKLLKLSVNDFLAAMTIAKIYSAPNSFVTVFCWDEETQGMELSINNMFFKIDPAIVNINHPVAFWHDCYKRQEIRSKDLVNNYYPEKS